MNTYNRHLRMSCGGCEKWLRWAPQVEPLITLADGDVEFRCRWLEESDDERAWKWLSHRKPLPNGRWDDAYMYKVCAVLLKRFAIPQEEVVEMLEEWSGIGESSIRPLVAVVGEHGAT